VEHDSQILTKAAEEYHLEVNGVKFWTPYWINWNTPPFFLNAPFDGKGTPGQIKSVLLRRIQEEKQTPRSAADYQRLTLGWGLGIDCSGLAYYLLSHWLRQVYNLRLTDYLYTPKADVVEASRKPHWQKAGVKPAQIDALPAQVSVSQVCELFHRHPMHITNVARLTSKQAAVTVPKAKDTRPGDMVKLTGPSGQHIGIVVAVNAKRLRYVDSRGFAAGVGSVRYQDIVIKDPEAGLEQQYWQDRKVFDPKANDRLCRLRVIDERTRIV